MVNTLFSEIYDIFFSKITDDMYMEMNRMDTEKIVQELLIAAIHEFEFPRIDLDDYQLEELEDQTTYQGVETNWEEAILYIYNPAHFNNELTEEEKNILATYMIVEWIGQQLASVENIRMKYSGSDFKFTSQAAHLSKLISLKEHYKERGLHLQRLYKRRKKDKKGIDRPTIHELMGYELGTTEYPFKY